jgi:hypothetical protein
MRLLLAAVVVVVGVVMSCAPKGHQHQPVTIPGAHRAEAP